MYIHVDGVTDIAPGFAAVFAQQDAADLSSEAELFRISRLDGDTADMRLNYRHRVSPAPLVREPAHTRKLLPCFTAVSALPERRRFSADVDGLRVVGIHS